ncbi:MAG: triose-phosphate isomerase [Propionicimonas sp.]
MDADRLQVSVRRPGRLGRGVGGLHRRDLRVDAGQLGCTYVVVGHSRRQQYHAGPGRGSSTPRPPGAGRGDAAPIVCASGRARDPAGRRARYPYTLAQVDGSLAGFTAEQVAGLVVAYEARVGDRHR